MSDFRIGRHIGINQQFVDTSIYAKSIGCTIFQIFLAIPQKILPKNKQKIMFVEMGKELVKHNIKMVVHGSYMINLCHNKNSPRYNSSLKSLL